MNKHMMSIPYGLPKEVALQAVQEKWPSAVLEEVEGSERNFYMSLGEEELNNVTVNAVMFFLEGVLWYYEAFQSSIVKVLREVGLNQHNESRR